MAAKKATSVSISGLEKQIAKVSAELEKAREKKLTAAEKSLASAQKAATSLAQKLTSARAKGATTAAAKARVKKAQADVAKQERELAAARQLVDSLQAQQEQARETAKAVAEFLAADGATAKRGAKAKAPVKTRTSVKTKATAAASAASKNTDQSAPNDSSTNGRSKKQSRSAAKISAKPATDKAKEKTKDKNNSEQLSLIAAEHDVATDKPAGKKESSMKRAKRIAGGRPALISAVADTSKDERAVETLNQQPRLDEQFDKENETGQHSTAESEAVPTAVVAEQPIPSHTTIGMIEPRDRVLPKPVPVMDPYSTPRSGNHFESDEES